MPGTTGAGREGERNAILLDIPRGGSVQSFGLPSIWKLDFLWCAPWPSICIPIPRFPPRRSERG